MLCERDDLLPRTRHAFVQRIASTQGLHGQTYTACIHTPGGTHARANIPGAWQRHLCANTPGGTRHPYAPYTLRYTINDGESWRLHTGTLGPRVPLGCTSGSNCTQSPSASTRACKRSPAVSPRRMPALVKANSKLERETHPHPFLSNLRHTSCILLRHSLAALPSGCASNCAADARAASEYASRPDESCCRWSVGAASRCCTPRGGPVDTRLEGGCEGAPQ